MCDMLILSVELNLQRIHLFVVDNFQESTAYVILYFGAYRITWLLTSYRMG